MMQEGFTIVPLELTIDHLDAFKDREVLLLGCNSPTGRGSFGFPRKDQPTLCRTKHPVEVFLLTARTAKDLRDLAARDVGWGQELMDARRIIDAAKPTSCGSFNETTAVEEKLGIQKIVARYSLDAGAAGACAITKISSAPVVAPSPSADSSGIPAPSASAASAASAAPAASASLPAPSATPPPKSGCGGCATSGVSSSWPAAGLLLVLGLVALRRPRPRD